MFTLTAASAMAFHGGGVAHCDGCHSMHNSPENPIGQGELDALGNVISTAAAPNEALMKGTDASSTCLNCHNGKGGYHIASSDGSNLNTGGDFGWLSQAYDYDVRGTTYTADPDNFGHNVVAVDFGWTADATNLTTPGSSLGYNPALLGCTSCHDAHGQVNDGTKGGGAPVDVSGSYTGTATTGVVGNFRLLGDSMYEAGHNINDGFAFSNGAPIAISQNSYSTSYGAWSRYASGMSEWCANCHDEYLNTAPDAATGKHPTSVLLSKDGYDANYNAYVATGNFTGTSATAYDPLVPFETGGTRADLIAATATDTNGPGATAQVMCLSCHRAHASAFNNMGRWDFDTEFLAHSAVLHSPDVDIAGGAAPYYGDNAVIDVETKYGASQRSLCNKCHVQD
ncbi:MAG: hypothetical protein R6W72_04560 [Desulfurivibrionaceae bacterium]